MHTICKICIKYALNMHQICKKNMQKICHYIDFNIANLQIICKKYAKIMLNMQQNMQKICN